MNSDGDEQYRRDFREIFAATGHETLKALLIVSGGSSVAYLTFLGNAFGEVDIARQIGEAAATDFIKAMQWFITSVAICVLAYGTTYMSHGAYHYRRDTQGNLLMAVTIVLGFSSLISFSVGSYQAVQAFGSAAKNITKQSSSPGSARHADSGDCRPGGQQR